jgi:glycosyltransferase involved in cell wall biosynthesis
MVQEIKRYLINSKLYSPDCLEENYKVGALNPACNEERTINKIIRLTEKYVYTVIVCDNGSGYDTAHACMIKRETL